MIINLDTIEKGYYEVYVNDIKVSQHTKPLKAAARAQLEKDNDNLAYVYVKQPNLEPVVEVNQGENVDSLLIEIEEKTNIINQMTEEIERLKSITNVSEISNLKLDGVSDDGVLFNQALKLASDNKKGIQFFGDFVLATSVQIVIPSGLRYFNCPNLTIKQLDNVNLESVVTTENFGNNYGEYKLKIDGNRANNNIAVGFKFGGSAAGNRFKFDFSFSNCKTGLLINQEVEHCNFEVYAKDVGDVVVIDTTSKTADENCFKIWSYESGTIFKTIGTVKSSGTVEIHAEQNGSWAIDLENGWFNFSGIVRSTGKFSGGGIKLSNRTSQITFTNFQIYGDPDAVAVSETLGLLVDTRYCDVSGSIKFGAFGTTVWMKHYNIRTDLFINAISPSRNGETLKFGDFENRLLADAGSFKISNNGTWGNYSAINLEYATNVNIETPNYINGTNEEIIIGPNSSKNLIKLGPRMKDVRITNNRTQNDNTILYYNS